MVQVAKSPLQLGLLKSVPLAHVLDAGYVSNAISKGWPSGISWAMRLKAAHNNTADAVTRLHVLKCFVDVRQRLSVRDKFVNLELAGHVVVNKIWKLCSALNTTKGTTLPLATCYKLEGCVPMSVMFGLQ